MWTVYGRIKCLDKSSVVAFTSPQGCLLLYGTYLAGLTSNVSHPPVNQSPTILTVVTLVTISTTVALPVSVFLQAWPNVVYSTVAGAIFICTLASNCMLFVPQVRDRLGHNAISPKTYFQTLKTMQGRPLARRRNWRKISGGKGLSQTELSPIHRVVSQAVNCRFQILHRHINDRYNGSSKRWWPICPRVCSPCACRFAMSISECDSFRRCLWVKIT